MCVHFLFYAAFTFNMVATSSKASGYSGCHALSVLIVAWFYHVLYIFSVQSIIVLTS